MTFLTFVTCTDKGLKLIVNLCLVGCQIHLILSFQQKDSLILAVDTRSSGINEEHFATMQDNIKQ